MTATPVSNYTTECKNHKKELLQINVLIAPFR